MPNEKPPLTLPNYRLHHRLFFVFVNSFYSFYWDVAKDWDLTLFASPRERNNPDHAWGLRRHTFFHTKEIYYGAIFLDLMLRCTWSFKLSPHLDHFNDLEGGIFVMELLEVFRRFIWIFFRVETEWGKLIHTYIPSLHIYAFLSDGNNTEKLPRFYSFSRLQSTKSRMRKKPFADSQLLMCKHT